MLTKRFLLLVILVSFISLNAVSSPTNSWNGGYGLWSQFYLWSNWAVPGPADNVLIGTDIGDDVILDTSATVQSLTLGNSGLDAQVVAELEVYQPLVVNGQLDLESNGFLINYSQVSAGTLQNNWWGELYIAPGASLNLTNQPLGVTDTDSGAYFIQGSFTAGSNGGFVNLTNLGDSANVILANGQTTDIFPLNGKLTNAGILRVEMGSTLTVNGDLQNDSFVFSAELGGGGNNLIVTGTLTNNLRMGIWGVGDTLTVGSLVNNISTHPWYDNILDIPNGGTLNVLGNAYNSGLLDTSYYYPTGGNTITIGGTLTNTGTGTFWLGGPGDTGNVGTLVNTGNVYIASGATLNLTNQAGGIIDVAAGSSFDIAGTFNAGTNSAFYQLTSVEGTVILANGQVTSDTPFGGTLTISSTGEIDLKNNSTLQVNGNIDNSGTFNVDPSTLIVTGTLTNEAGSTLTLTPGDVLTVGAIVNKGTSGIPGGATLQTPYYMSSGNTSVDPMATLLVGTGAAGNTGYYQIANGTLGEFINMNGFGVIVVNGPVHLDGTLEVQLDPGFNPTVGSTYEFITFTPGSYDGTMFATILNDIFNNGTERWVVVYDNADGYIELQAEKAGATPEPASLMLLGTGLVAAGVFIRRKINL